MERILPKFYRRTSSFKFEDLAKALFGKSTFDFYKNKEDNVDFLVNFPLNTTISGCPTIAALKTYIGEDWQTKMVSAEIETKDNETKRVTTDYVDVWHAWFSFDDKKKLEKFAKNRLNIQDKDLARKFSGVKLQQGYANLSTKAITKILPWLNKGLLYSHAVFMANMDAVIHPDYWKNAEDRKRIQNEIERIIDSHRDEIRKVQAVNVLLKEAKQWTQTSLFDKEVQTESLDKKLKAHFGEKSFNQRTDKEDLREGARQILEKCLSKSDYKTSFARIPTLEGRIKDFIEAHFLLVDEKAFDRLYHPSQLDDFVPDERTLPSGEKIKVLPSPKTDSIKNPVLMRALHKLRGLVNELLIAGVIDEDTRIHLELAREVNDANRRAAWKKWQDKLRDKREEARKEIREHGQKQHGENFEPTEDDVLRYLLWKEQDGRTIYEDEAHQIGLSDIIGSDPKFDIEHTIPRSRSWDNSMANKTLCSKEFNRFIKKDKTPFELGERHERILVRIDKWRKQIYELSSDINAINTRGVTDKKLKDCLIQKRHELTFERNYWRDKYERFTMKEIPEGFKNSQMVDTGLITRFAKKYLTSVFKTSTGNPNVHVVNGQSVAAFRKAWGLQEEFEKKSRANHVHHCIDAITIACISRAEYQAFAEEWRKTEEYYEKVGVAQRTTLRLPWETFTEDLKHIHEKVLVVHEGEHNVRKQTKKKKRRRGKVVKNAKTGKPIYLQGDTARGSLHQDTFYGKIQNPETGEFEFVVRKAIDGLKEADLKKIIDPKIREICLSARGKENEAKKQLKKLKDLAKEKERLGLNEEHSQILSEIAMREDELKQGFYFIPPGKADGKPTPIRKVRIKAINVKEPLPEFKKHRDVKKGVDGQPLYEYKQEVYVQNDENYGLALYEDPKMLKRAAKIINMKEATDYYKASNRKLRKEQAIVERVYKKLPLKGILKRFDHVLFWEHSPEEIWELNQGDRVKRLYYIKKMSKDTRCLFQYHQESRNDTEIKNDYKEQFDTEIPNIILNGKSKWINKENLEIRYLINPLNMNMLIEGLDFRINKRGGIERMD